MTMPRSKIVPHFEFTEAVSLSLAERFARSLARARELLAISDYQSFCDFPCLPSAANEAELQKLEARLDGEHLPDEYREFLKLSRYLKIDDGTEIGGLDHEGKHVTEVPWISDQHRVGKKYLVFANYWHYSDGDQLMFDLSEPSKPVIAYLHEYGPLFKEYAPTFSLALWRLVHEDFPG